MRQSRKPLVAPFVFVALLASPLKAQDTIEALKKSANDQIEIANTEIIFKKADLNKKYVAALDALEKTLTASGKLDQVVHLREERDLVSKSGETTTHADKELADLRSKYQKGLEAIEAPLEQVKAKIAAEVTAKGRAGEAALTKAGKIDEALAYRKDVQQLLLELGGSAAKNVPVQDDPRTTAPTTLSSLEPIKLPQASEMPATVDDAFSNPDRWLESLTVKTAKQRLSKAILLGDRGKKKWPLICVAPGSQWIGEEKVYVENSAARFYATKSRFNKIKFINDLECYNYYIGCGFDDCLFERGGVWYGSDMGGKFYFDSCLIQGSFARKFDHWGNALRAQNSVFVDVDFPDFSFNKKQPAEFLNHKWLRMVNCRFVKCKLPLSFILLTRDCIFEDCTFIDSAPAHAFQNGITNPVEITVYTDRCRNQIENQPPAVKIVTKPVSALTTSVPTLSQMESQIGK